MVKSDILLDDEGIDAIPADGSFNLTTGRDAVPDIRLSPNSAAIRLGGGDGEFSDGDIRLLDRPGDGSAEPRIHLTGGTGATESGTRVRVNGRQGTAKLGATSADDPDIALRSALGQLRLGGGAGDEGDDGRTVGNVRLDDENEHSRVFLSADGAAPPNGTENAAFLSTISDEYGLLSLKRVGESFADATVTLDAGSGRLALGSKTQSSRLAMFRQGNVGTVTIDGHDADLRLGGTDADGNNGVAGDIALENAAGNRTVSVAGGPSGSNGARLSLGDDGGTTTADVSGAEAGLRLGNGAADGGAGIGGSVDLENPDGETTVSVSSDQPNADGAGATIANAAGTITAAIDGAAGSLTLGADSENGTLSLEDGAGMTVDLTADAGSVRLEHSDSSKGEISLELEPEAGIFSVLDGDGDPVFRIDTQEQSIEKARGYSRGVIGTGKPSSPGKGQGQGQGNAGGQSGGN